MTRRDVPSENVDRPQFLLAGAVVPEPKEPNPCVLEAGTPSIDALSDSTAQEGLITQPRLPLVEGLQPLLHEDSVSLLRQGGRSLGPIAKAAQVRIKTANHSLGGG